MTVKELRKRLARLPGELKVVYYDPNDAFGRCYVPIEDVRKGRRTEVDLLICMLLDEVGR